MFGFIEWRGCWAITVWACAFTLIAKPLHRHTLSLLFHESGVWKGAKIGWVLGVYNWRALSTHPTVVVGAVL